MNERRIREIGKKIRQASGNNRCVGKRESGIKKSSGKDV